MAAKEVSKDTMPILSVKISLTAIQKVIRGVRTDGKVTLSKPDDNGNISVTIQATSKAGPDHPHTGRFYPIEGMVTVPEVAFDSDEKKFAFIKAAYTAGLNESTTYRDTEAGTKPKVIKTTASTVKSERDYLVAQGVAPEQVDLIIAALDKKAGK
ncbi:hypothetical protein LCGC14_2020290 [marine sediment metagenome]|uniref:Uncharacterized protein n=1 Tax=marine sediment metagenome TaxID=412755 RepID=A0A0F9EXS2_9ZZZZ